MPSDFNTIRKLYDDDRFVELLHHPNGIFWLKLRSISRAEQMRQFCQRIGLDTNGIPSRQLFEHVYNRISQNLVCTAHIARNALLSQTDSTLSVPRFVTRGTQPSSSFFTSCSAL